ncbi:MAG TPA: hypothetical protein VGZ27_20150 [Vicinamibacterales bacterium]|nr:hypothetical protein [Vicinamibacterales bacterium]
MALLHATGKHISAAATCALVCAAAAFWVSFGAIAFLDTGNRARYVGILPAPIWLLAAFLVAAVLAYEVRPTARGSAPLWLSGMLLLPWLPVRLPLSVFVWTGHVAVWVWIAIGAMLAAPLVRGALRPLQNRLHSASGSALLAGGIGLVVYGLGVWATAPQHPNGDEPHYLIITQSLLEDRDLQIENNHLQRDYRAYSTTTLKPDYRARGKNGAIYSIHAPGLPLLVAPFFAAFGYHGVVGALLALSAFASGLAWYVAWQVTRNQAASWFGWAGVSLSVPYFFLTGTVFPDGPAAALVLAGIVPLVSARARQPRWLFAVGAALAMLPWLHSRFAILAACCALVVAGRLLSEHGRAKRLAALVTVPAVSAVGWLCFFQIIYGTPNPSAPYGGTLETAAGNIVRGAPGLLFDQQFGLLPNAPIYLCAFAGLAVMLWRGPRRLAVELLIVTLPYFVVVTFFYMWWGGTSAPARFLVPLTLVLAIPTATWFADIRGAAARAFGVGALFTSVLITATMTWVARGELVFNFRDGSSRLAAWLLPAVDLTRALPSLFQNPPSVVVGQTAIWLAAVAAAMAATMAVQRWGSSLVVLSLAMQVTITCAVSLVWRTNHAAAPIPSSGGASVLRQYDNGSGQLALEYRPFRRIPLQSLPAEIPLARLVTANRSEWSKMVHLPPGIYEITGTVRGHPAGRIRVMTDPDSPAIGDWTVASLSTTWKNTVSLPVAVAALELDLDEAARGSLRNVELRAVSVLPPRDRIESGSEAGHGARYGSAVMFHLSGPVWVEPDGTWIGRGADADFVIAPDVRETLHLFVRNGAVKNQVTLESGDWLRNLDLAPSEESVIEIPVHEGPGTPLTVRSLSGFRPSDVDATSQDDRFLGVWIATR